MTLQHARSADLEDLPTTAQHPAAYSAQQLRVDLWWSIADAARAPHLDPEQRGELAESLHQELALMEVLETHYAFPGHRLAATLRDLANGAICRSRLRACCSASATTSSSTPPAPGARQGRSAGVRGTPGGRAMTVRNRIAAHPLLSKYFQMLRSSDLISDRYRAWGRACPGEAGQVAVEEAWGVDEFVLEPSRLTVRISATGIDGETFEHDFLMDRIHGLDPASAAAYSVGMRSVRRHRRRAAPRLSEPPGGGARRAAGGRAR